jgi:hypothetical protein
MAGYTRQSVADILNGSEITAPPINAEFNQLVAAFNGSTGHSHDGSTGNAPKIDLTTSISGYLPAAHGGIGGRNKFDATSAPATSNDNSEGYAPGSMWENVTDGRVYICVGNTSNAAVWRELVTIFSGPKIEPVAHNTIDIGTNTVRFKDLYLQGGATIAGNSTFAGTLGVSGLSTLDSLTVTNATTLNGAVTIGNSSADLVGFNGRLTTGLVPNTDDNVDLGTSTLEWRNLYLDGTAHIDTLDVDENAGIDGNLSVGGTLGVTGTTTYSTATGSNLTATGTINFANATVSNLGTVTTAAIGGGSLNNVVIGGSTPAAITGTTITGTSLVGPLTGNVTGNVTGNLTGNVTGNVTGNLTGNVTATSGTSNFTNVTISGQLNMDATSAATITNLSAPVSDNDAARKIDVDNAVANLVDSAPGTLDTLNELAAALGDDPDFATTITNSIATKLPKAGGTMSGAINMGGQKITNAADPTAAQDLATKNYIDTTYVDYSSAGDAATDARKLATNAEDVQYTLADGSTTGYSALHYAAKAAASYDSFDDRYLGSKASDPTLDNDNNALITGALYFDSTNGVMKVYNGTEWANASSSIEGIKSNFYYTATSGQTGFSGSDDNSNTLVIDKAGLVNVYMNGVRLHEDDYTVSASGDSVTLASGAATGDLIYLEVFGNFAGQSGADVAITGGSITGLTELGIGEASPDRSLHISASVPAIKLEDTDVAGLYHEIVPTAAGQVQFKVDAGNVQANSKFVAVIDGSERLKVDTSGIDVIGSISLTGAGSISSQNTSDLVLNATDDLFLNAGGSTGLGIFQSGGSLQNVTAYTSILPSANDTHNLGASTLRWNRLFMGMNSPQTDANITIRTNGNALEWGHNNVSSGYYGVLGTNVNNGNPFIGFSANANSGTGNTYDTDGFLGTILRGTTGGELSIEQVTNADADNQSAIQRIGIAATEVVINEGSSDTDFRVESNTRTHAIFVDAGNDSVGLMDSNPSSSYPVTIGGIGTSQLLLRSTGDSGYTQGSMVIQSGTTDNPGNRGQGVYYFNEGNDRTWYAGTLYGNGTSFGIGTITGASLAVNAANNTAAIMHLHTDSTVFNELGNDRDFRVESDNTTHMLYVDAGLDSVGIGTGNLTTARSMFVAGKGIGIRNSLNGNNDNWSSIYNSEAGSASNLIIQPGTGGGFTFTHGSGLHTFPVTGYDTVFNQNGNDADFRIESDDDANMFFVDANNNKIGIRYNSPSSTLHIRPSGEASLTVGSSNAGGALLVLDGDANGDASGGDYAYLKHTTSGNLIIENLATAGTEIVVNETGNDMNFRVESDGSVNALFIDAGNNHICIGGTNADPGNGNTNTGAGFRSVNSATNLMFSVSRNSGNACRFNRNTSTGELIIMSYSGNNVGNISVTSTSTSYNTSSDHRLKENVVDLTGATERLKQLAPKRFNFIADEDTTVDGFIAHEAQTVVPEAVTGTHNEVDDDGNPVYQGIDQSKLVPLLTAALQEAITKIEDLEARVAALEA